MIIPAGRVLTFKIKDKCPSSMTKITKQNWERPSIQTLITFKLVGWDGRLSSIW